MKRVDLQGAPSVLLEQAKHVPSLSLAMDIAHLFGQTVEEVFWKESGG